MSERSAGINRAYEFVLPSYSWALQRIEATHSRLQNLQTYAATITFAAPVIIKSLEPSAPIDSGWFVAALVLFGIIGVGGLVVRMFSAGLRLISPAKLTSQEWLTLSDEDFKLQMLEWSGEDMSDNAEMINHEAFVADFLSLLLIVEVICLAIWAAKAL